MCRRPVRNTQSIGGSTLADQRGQRQRRRLHRHPGRRGAAGPGRVYPRRERRRRPPGELSGPSVRPAVNVRPRRNISSRRLRAEVTGRLDRRSCTARPVRCRKLLSGQRCQTEYGSSAALRRMPRCRLSKACTKVLSLLETPRRVNFRVTRVWCCVGAAQGGTHVSQTSRELSL